MSYCIYLRKSRLDIEAEAHGEGETLERHKTMLLNYAKRNSLPISKIYQEVVSGESIEARPEMQQLLEDVENGMWEGVLVIEVERLARGDAIDQGIVARAFKIHNTKIITPIKIYDPANEFDEEYFEFGLFMSRREYKVINRRIQRGRVQSAKEGRWLAPVAPYGHNRIKIKNDKGYTLEPNKEEAPIVNMMLNMYVNELVGSGVIANRLDAMGIKTRSGKPWSRSAVDDIITNPVHIGMVRWGYKKETKDPKTGQKHRTVKNEYIYVKGMHPAIVDVDLFNKALEIRESRRIKTTKQSLTLQNPLSGTIHCKKCGALMTRLGPNSHCRYDTLKCSNRYCDNVSAPISSIEAALIQNLKIWLKNAEINIEKEYQTQSKNKIRQIGVDSLKNELKTVERQIQKSFDLLEQGIYTTEIFTERNTILNNRKKDIEQKILDLDNQNNKVVSVAHIREKIIPKLKELIESYFSLEDAKAKNTILKTILNDVTYVKEKRNTRGKADNMNFELEIMPKMFSEFQL